MTVKRKARHRYVYVVLFFTRKMVSTRYTDGSMCPQDTLANVRGAFISRKNAEDYGRAHLSSNKDAVKPILGDVCEVKKFTLQSEMK